MTGLHVIKGDPTAEELAALTVVLLARAAGTPAVPAARPRRPARWQRLERSGGFEGAHTWQYALPLGR